MENMNLKGYFPTIIAALLLSWFFFQKYLKYRNRSLERATSSASISETKSTSSLSSSQSSYADSEGKYDVFLSFRGEDTRHGFIDYLYNDLVDAGIYTFRDSEKPSIGELISRELFKAIEDSRIWITVFSKNYANSVWCFREFTHIVKCQLENKERKIYPIFYNMNVYDVKNQQGSYKKSFQEHEKNFPEKTVRKWRKALKAVGKFKGYELNIETDRYEGRLAKKIVKDVLLELKNNHTLVPDNLVGIDRHVQEMTRLLELNFNGIRIVGIHGMGGIGKTTIAKVVYNKLCDIFDGCCFLEDVRERVNRHQIGFFDLQKQLILQVFKRDFPDIVDVNDGIKKIKYIAENKKVIIVLDDVDEKSQIDKIVGQCDWFKKGSRIIITTRNKEVLNALAETCKGKGLHEACKSYEPELMNIGDSLQLFSKYTFMREAPPKDYLILSQNIIILASGLPLVLVTLGSVFLGIRDKALWVAKIKKLRKLPDRDVMGKLKISFDALDDANKKIFLDIACLFVGKDKTEPFYMWEDCEFFPDDGLNTLVLRSLVKIGDDNKLKMHDKLRDLGRQIVREETMFNLSRVWRREEALKLLEGGSGVENVEALILDLSEIISYPCEEHIGVIGQEYKEVQINGNEYYVRRLKGQSFSRLQNLRFLRLGFVILDKYAGHLFSNLRWLEWTCCDNSTQSKLDFGNLVILNLSDSTITDNWEGWSLLKAARKLKVLNISSCLGLIRGLDLSTFKALKTLNLNSCKSLLEVGGLENLECLTILNMKECKSITRFHGLSNLKKLKELQLEGCTKLRYIDGLEGLISLEYLNLSGCGLIQKLHGLSNLKMLRNLHLNNCKRLSNINGLEDLLFLEYLDLTRCKSITTLPKLSNLKMLQILYLNFCNKLREINGLEDLVSLQYLDMAICSSIKRLPDLSNLRMLKTLIATVCDEIPEFKGLECLVSLEKLFIMGCSVERLPNLSNLRRLKELSLINFPRLCEIEGLSGLISLETLDLKYCISLTNNLDFSYLKNLKTLSLEGVNHWTEIKGLEELKYLKVLDLRECRSLVKLPDLSDLANLRYIYIEGCTKLLGSIQENEEA